MNGHRTHSGAALLAVLVCLTLRAAAQNYDLSWYTVDGGGRYSALGDYELEGTIGQSDASSFAMPMTGGSFELVGGFWPAAAPGACACPADVTGDGQRNGADIAGFVGCLLGSGANCACADLDRNGTLNMTDLGLFVDVLLSGAGCP